VEIEPYNSKLTIWRQFM